MGVEAIKVTLLVPPENDVFEKVVFRVLSTRPVPPSASPDTDARKVCFWSKAAQQQTIPLTAQQTP